MRGIGVVLGAPVMVSQQGIIMEIRWRNGDVTRNLWMCAINSSMLWGYHVDLKEDTA